MAAEAIGGVTGGRSGPLLSVLVLLVLRWMPAQPSSCDGICGRRPLAVRHNQLRLVGGTNALPGTWPWQVSIQLRTRWGDYMHMCGGALISSHWVVSAAHCLGKPKERYKLVLGCNRVLRPGPDAQHRFVKRLVKHGHVHNTLKTRGTILNDIALVELSEPVACTDYVQPACLPDSRVALSALTDCYISGWGNTNPQNDRYPDILQEGKVDFLPRRNCSKLWNRPLPAMNLCARLERGGTGTCQGDSGGPIQCREERSERYWVLGVLSWGPLACGATRQPSVFISLQYFRDWIQQQTKEEDLSTPVRLPVFARVSTPARRTPPPTTKPSRPASWLSPPMWARPTALYSWISPGRFPPPQWRSWSPPRPKTTRWYPRTRPHGWSRHTHRPMSWFHLGYPLQP
nr:acrosin-like [Pogona vitticeps]